MLCWQRVDGVGHGRDGWSTARRVSLYSYVQFGVRIPPCLLYPDGLARVAMQIIGTGRGRGCWLVDGCVLFVAA